MTGIDRRELLQRAILLAGGAAVPVQGLEALAAAAAKGPQLLDKAHFALLSAVTDTMVPRTDTPGAVDVGVPRLFDGLLRTWATPQRRADLIAELDKIDAIAMSERKQPFAQLSAQDRYTLLSAHDAAAGRPAAAAAVSPSPVKPAPTTVDPNYGRPRQEPTMRSMMGGAAGGYAKLKELIVVLYYFSEPALTKELEYQHVPGKWQPSVPVTPATRAQGGLAAN